jgi:hypothetical protein
MKPPPVHVVDDRGLSARRLPRRLRQLGLLFDGLIGLIGTAMVLIGAVRMVREVATLPNSSLVVTGLGVAALALARSRCCSRLLQRAVPTRERERLQQRLGQLSLLAIGAFLLYRLQVSDLRAYAGYFKEGSVAEWLTFVVFLVAAPIALTTAVQSWRRQERDRGLVWGLFGLACALVAMEEVSWGQILFDWGTPEFFDVHNSQNETNLHNLAPIQEHLWSITAVVFCAVALLALVRVQLESRGLLRADSLAADLLPVRATLPLLIFAALTSIAVAFEMKEVDLPILITRDQEVAEFAFGIACLLAACRGFLHQARRWDGKTEEPFSG